MTAEGEAKKAITDGLKLTIPGIPPSGNHYIKHGVIRGQLRSYKTAEARKFAATVAAIVAGRTIAPESPKERKKVAYRIIVEVILGKKQRQDADNGLKVTIDSLKDCKVIHSDARVQEAIGRVDWKQRPAQGRTEIFAEVIK